MQVDRCDLKCRLWALFSWTEFTQYIKQIIIYRDASFPRGHLRESHLLANLSITSFLLCLDEHSLQPGPLSTEPVIRNHGMGSFWWAVLATKAPAEVDFFFSVSKLTSFFPCHHIFVSLAWQSLCLPAFGCTECIYWFPLLFILSLPPWYFQTKNVILLFPPKQRY